jgi:hypothetical protein
MGQIYKNTSRVISYLGPAQQTDSEGFRLLEHIHQQYKHLYDGSGLLEDINRTAIKYSDPN